MLGRTAGTCASTYIVQGIAVVLAATSEQAAGDSASWLMHGDSHLLFSL